MAEKSFGIKKIGIQGSGTPTIVSPDNGNFRVTAANSIFSGDITLSGGVIYGDGSGLSNVSLAQGLTGTPNISVGTIVASGNVTFNSDVTLGDDLSNDTLSINAQIDSHLIPKAHTSSDLYNLGSGTLRWNDIFATGTIYADAIRLDDATGKLQIGSAPDLELYHNNTDGYIDNNKGHLYIRNNVNDDDGGNIRIQAKSGEDGIIINDDSYVQLYSDGAVKFQTAGSGGLAQYGNLSVDHLTPGQNDTYDLGHSLVGWRDAYVRGQVKTPRGNLHVGVSSAAGSSSFNSSNTDLNPHSSVGIGLTVGQKLTFGYSGSNQFSTWKTDGNHGRDYGTYKIRTDRGYASNAVYGNGAGGAFVMSNNDGSVLLVSNFGQFDIGNTSNVGGNEYNGYLFQMDGTVKSCISSTAKELASDTAGTAPSFIMQRRTNGKAFSFRDGDAPSDEVGSISFNISGSTSFNETSDYRIKENVVGITSALDKINQLRPVNFNFIGKNMKLDGFIAHEVQAVIPYAVTGEKDAVKTVKDGDHSNDGTKEAADRIATLPSKEVPDLQQLDKSKLIALLTASVQELSAKNNALEARIAALEGS